MRHFSKMKDENEGRTIYTRLSIYQDEDWKLQLRKWQSEYERGISPISIPHPYSDVIWCKPTFYLHQLENLYYWITGKELVDNLQID